MRFLAAVVAITVAGTPAAAQLPRLQEVALPASLSEVKFVPDTMVGISVHPSGCLVMSDADESQVVCVSLTTGATRRIGRHGSGPGEFGRIGAIAIFPSGGLLIHDAANGRLTTVNADWTIGESRTLPSRITGGLFRPTGQSVFALGGIRGWDLVSVSLASGAVASNFSPGHADSALFDLPAYHAWAFYLAAGGANTWLVASLGKNAVLRLDANGKLVSRAMRVLPTEYPSPAEGDRRRAFFARMGSGTSPDQQARINSLADAFLRSPKPTASVHGFADDRSGRLWVVTPRLHSDSTELDVFQRNGAYLGTRRIAGQVQGIAFADGDLLVLREVLVGPSAGAQGVCRYRLVGGAP